MSIFRRCKTYSGNHQFGRWQTYYANSGKGLPTYQVRECAQCQKIQKRKVR